MPTSSFDKKVIIKDHKAARSICKSLSSKPLHTKPKHNMQQELNEGIKILERYLSR
ncbi:MAG: hypothetical protein Q7J16_01665 [Candidatus Cloacimonadales bacterium]|nr:hypothetical protein [Candidatus Cloacimonadales bacterium]